MKSRGIGILSASAWALAATFGLAACWDAASLNVSTSELTGLEGGTDASTDAPSESAAACASPRVTCGLECVDTSSDPINCGGCGTVCLIPPPPTCAGTIAKGFGPGMCAAGACVFPESSMDCGALNRACFGGQCTQCLAGFQDNDGNGSCTPDCGTSGLTCSGNGACSDTTGTAACVCLPGFSGVACATNVDDCAGAPCLNGGMCIDGVGSYSCNCAPGFTGANCQTNVDDCAGAPCLNGGMCVDGVNSYTCNCAPGYSGANCATPTPTFLWLDATDAATITKDGANNVTEWRDKSGLGRHATVPAGSVAPVWTAAVVNALPAVSFNGGTVRLQTAAVPTSAEMTIFVVFNMVSPFTWGSLINQAHDTYFSIRKSDCCGGNGNLNFHIQNDNAQPLQPINANTWQVLTALRQGTTSTMYYTPGAATSYVGDTLTGGVNVPITIGNAMSVAESMGGYISEIRAYVTPLDAPTRAGIESVLKAKYAVP